MGELPRHAQGGHPQSMFPRGAVSQTAPVVGQDRNLLIRQAVQLVLCAVAAIAAPLADLATGQQPQPVRSPKTILATFQVEEGGGPLIIPVTLEMESTNAHIATRRAVYRMLVDTGASVTVFDIAHRSALGKMVGKTHGHTASGQLEVSRFWSPVLSFGAIRVRPTSGVACLDLQPIADGFGEKIDGLLGMDVLRRLAFSIDFDSGTIEFVQTVDATFGRPVELSWDDQIAFDCPLARARVGNSDAAAAFLIDTGGVHTVAGTLESSIYDQLAHNKQLVPAAEGGRVFTAAKKIDVELGLAARFSLGAFTHEHLAFLRFPHNCLCLGYLSRFSVAFDFPRSRMYLRPGKSFARRDQYNLTGLNVSRSGEAIIAVVGSADGAAARAGIRTGDQILAIDGAAARTLSLSAIRRALATGSRHHVAVRRRETNSQFAADLDARSLVSRAARQESP